MSGAPGTPSNFYVQTANQQNLVSWSLASGATSYIVQRSLDNVTFTTLATLSGSPLATSYLDTAVTIGTQYWYQVAAANTNGTGIYTTAQAATPTTTGEMTLAQIRLQAQERADRVNSNFVTLPEWNTYINQAMYELYDLLITAYQDYYIATPVNITADGSTFLYGLPDGVATFQNGITGQNFVPPPFYKLIGVDLSLNNANNAYVTVNKFNFVDRNRFVYPNTASTIYGVFNLQYRLLGLNQVEFIPTPTAGQQLRFWYIPRLTALLQDTDVTYIGISGWLEYVIVRAAKYALDKEESDTSKLDTQIQFLKTRIEESAAARDAGMPDTVSDTNQGNWANGWYGGNSGAIGGWAVLLMPMSMPNNIGNHLLTHPILPCQGLLRYIFLAVAFSYFLYLDWRKFRSRIPNAGIRDFLAISTPPFIRHIFQVLCLRAKKQMTRINTFGVVTRMAAIESLIKLPLVKPIRKAISCIPNLIHRESTPTIFIKTTNPVPASRNIFNKISFKSWLNIFIRFMFHKNTPYAYKNTNQWHKQ